MDTRRGGTQPLAFKAIHVRVLMAARRASEQSTNRDVAALRRLQCRVPIWLDF